MTLLEKCWYNLSILNKQKVYQELVYQNKSCKQMLTGSAALPHPSFVLFYFRVCPFSILLTWLSRSLKQVSLPRRYSFRGSLHGWGALCDFQTKKHAFSSVENLCHFKEETLVTQIVGVSCLVSPLFSCADQFNWLKPKECLINLINLFVCVLTSGLLHTCIQSL